ncbi:hypothetical protein CGSMWGv55152_03987 [Gardnerella vaginalis 55152]|uniref:DUF4125 domain-containing protein n=1 Tax=Gardnerella vaginalis 55152 TaxID=698955 RepID=I4LTG5_GARVA|nr:DUF4125 family protein [Gardnerella vaginalis]EIK80255.1 hypothetical protein CGSMWGv55152_03987 [Gardnerella vaginalis 55152]
MCDSLSNPKTQNPKTQNLAEEITKLEWQQFQLTENEGGRANCQGDWQTFHIMRMSQFLTWPLDLQKSYKQDLERANSDGSNLITEKYARMMESTAPEIFERTIKPYIKPILEPRKSTQEQIILTQVKWADDFRNHYPHLGLAMRVLKTSEDTAENTSFETYLRGELSTYSDDTFAKYQRFVNNLRAENLNLTQMIITNTVRMYGYDSLESAECAH